VVVAVSATSSKNLNYFKMGKEMVFLHTKAPAKYT
jgi:hypothetical protein